MEIQESVSLLGGGVGSVLLPGFLMLFTPVGWLPTDREARARLA